MSYRAAVRERITVGAYELIPLLDGTEDLDSPGGMVDEFLSPSNDA